MSSNRKINPVAVVHVVGGIGTFIYLLSWQTFTWRLLFTLPVSLMWSYAWPIFWPVRLIYLLIWG